MNNHRQDFPAGSTALVQGASRGIGLGLVRNLLGDNRFERVIATCREPEQAEHLRQIRDSRLEIAALDISRPDQIERLGSRLRSEGIRIHLALNAAGVLHGPGFDPEKKLEDLDPDALRHVFTVNAFGPILLLKALRPVLALKDRSVFAAISARVGSIGDNRLGGWYAYRASKAALNQFLKTASIEMARRNRNVIVAALHPGTTDTELSSPFQGRVPEGKLFPVEKTAGLLMQVINGLDDTDNGGFFAWDGTAIAW